jgi:hypothetical protein
MDSVQRPTQSSRYAAGDTENLCIQPGWFFKGVARVDGSEYGGPFVRRGILDEQHRNRTHSEQLPVCQMQQPRQDVWLRMTVGYYETRFGVNGVTNDCLVRRVVPLRRYADPESLAVQPLGNGLQLAHAARVDFPLYLPKGLLVAVRIHVKWCRDCVKQLQMGAIGTRELSGLEDGWKRLGCWILHCDEYSAYRAHGVLPSGGVSRWSEYCVEFTMSAIRIYGLRIGESAYSLRAACGARLGPTSSCFMASTRGWRAEHTQADLIVTDCHAGSYFLPSFWRFTDWELMRYPWRIDI